jgi:hypothetical protein
MTGRATFWTILAVALAMAGLFALDRGGWPGEPNGCREQMRPNCFCERPRLQGVAQPANTWSNLGFVAAGVGIALAVDRRRGRGPSTHAARSNPMTEGFFHPTLYAIVVALLGPGSMALHATLTRWGGQLDVMSMYLFIAFVSSYGLMRAYSLGRGAFVAIYGVQLLVLAWTKFRLPVDSNFVFGAMIAVAIATDRVFAIRRPDLVVDRRWLLLAAGLFGTAFAIWIPSRSAGPLCDPDSLIQGHAIWHLLCAGATLAIYGYLCSEGPAVDLPEAAA